MHQRTLLVLSALFLTAAVSFAQSAEEAIKTILKNETMAFYGRKADAWQSGWLQDANISRAIIDNSNYSFATGWEKNGTPVVEMLKKKCGQTHGSWGH